MVGKQGEGVAQAFDDLILSEVASESEVGALSLAPASLAPAKSVRLSNVWLKSALVRLAPSSRASVKSAPDRSALARFAPESVAKRNDSPRSRAEARLTAPPFMVPICRLAALKKSLIRLGTVVGFCRRQSFHDRGPRRKTSTCSESANTVLGRKRKGNGPGFLGRNATWTV